MQENNPPEPEESPAFERHLATIMMADVVGYSRMMGENEERTVRMLGGHREVFDALLKAHRGRIFNTAGDAILAEFPSAVEAVRCATDIQSALRTRNEHFSEEQRMWFRIGINLGDVIAQGSDLLGDGVNIAARIQTLAEPGGVCISGSVYDQIQNKLTLQFKMMGERNFKNIAQPIRTFSITESENGPILPVNAPLPLSPQKNSRAMLLAAVAGFLLLVAGLGGYWLYQAREEGRYSESDPEQTAVTEQEVDARRQELALEAELAKAAREREAAETAQRQDEKMRLAVEAAQRRAWLEAEAEFAKAALARSEQEKQRLDQELRRAEAEKQATEAQRLALEAQTLKAAEERATAEEARRQAQEEARLAEEARRREEAALAEARQQEEVAAVAAGFDGFYEGTLCNEETNKKDRKCWPVLLKVRNGELSATWMTKVGKPAVAQGTIAPDGTVDINLAGWWPDGQAINATLAGKATDKTIKASGKWEGKLPVSGEWEKAD